jgi:catechol 2,3-dioxygenase-like lactoylglutathione lyase family enzyme
MLGATPLVAFVPATDLNRAREFYEHTLGLRCIDQDEFAVVFDADGTVLRVTATGELVRRGYTVLGWQLADITTAADVLSGRGVVFSRYDGLIQDGAGIWTAPDGSKVAWFCDPDGNILSLTEFGKDRRPG